MLRALYDFCTGVVGDLTRAKCTICSVVTGKECLLKATKDALKKHEHGQGLATAKAKAKRTAKVALAAEGGQGGPAAAAAALEAAAALAAYEPAAIKALEPFLGLGHGRVH